MNYIELYVKFLKKFLKPKRMLRVVFDCSNGSTGMVLRELTKFTKLNFVNFVLINEKPDGRFPAHGPNPMAEGAMDQMSKVVRREKADLGVIFDADGDRAFFMDKKGNLIDPDCVAYFLMREFKPPYVVDVRSGWILRKSPQLSSENIHPELVEGLSKLITSKVGHLFIKEAMRKNKASFGAEYSGHYYFKDFFYADSGILAAIFMMNIVSRFESISYEILKLPKYYRLLETNFRLSDKSYEAQLRKICGVYEKRAESISWLDGLTLEFGDWWMNLRASNTEPLLRLNMEAVSESILNKNFSEIVKILRS